MCVVSVPNKACSLDFPHQLASLDPISGWHAMIIHICMDDAAVHHYSATGTLDADVCAAAASGSLPRKDKGNSIHARIIMCRPQIASHPLFPPERKTTASGWTWTGTLQGLLFFCSKGKSRYLLALGPYQSHCSNYAEINISYT